MVKRELDFGSGYNPLNGAKTCDIYGYVDYYFDLINYRIKTDDKFSYIRCRNVIHHIKDLKRLSNEFNRVMDNGSILEIIEPNKTNYSENYYLDYLWYRYIIPRYEVWFSPTYRNCKNYFTEFQLLDYRIEDEKEVFIFKKS